MVNRERLWLPFGANDVRETVTDRGAYDGIIVDQHDERAGFARNGITVHDLIDRLEDHFPVASIVGEDAASKASSELVDGVGSRRPRCGSGARPVRQRNERSVRSPEDCEPVVAGIVGLWSRVDLEIHGSPRSCGHWEQQARTPAYSQNRRTKIIC